MSMMHTMDANTARCGQDANEGALPIPPTVPEVSLALQIAPRAISAMQHSGELEFNRRGREIPSRASTLNSFGGKHRVPRSET